ncbi:MAG: GTP pyrophosphokinase [Proteobacteria bacterium]|nr:GTP pyrophosphokinase [Pseudomonadota bacterium]
MPSIEDAVALAALAHKGQKDKAGQPYILHPLRVMLRLDSEAERMTAVLHDVIEDTRYTLEDLADLGYGSDVLEALDRVTERDDESYDEFIERAGGRPVSRRVKLADLEDNLDETRLPRLTGLDRKRLEKYRRARARLLEMNS